jgi:hypothetical protein
MHDLKFDNVKKVPSKLILESRSQKQRIIVILE